MPVPDASCGCVTHDGDGGRRAVAVDAESKERNLKRLRRVEGQVRSVSQDLRRNHLKHCATSAIQEGGASAGTMYDELVDLLYKHSR